MGIDPVSLAIISAVTTGLSTVAGMAGKAKESEAAAQNASYQAEVARNNQIIADQNSRLASEKGEVEATAQGLKNRAAIGALVAAQGASGVDVNSGSALDVRQSAQELAQLDALTIRSNASREAYGYRVEASNFANQAKMLKKTGGAISDSQPIDTFSSLLSGASSVTGKYLDWQQASGGLANPETIWV